MECVAGPRLFVGAVLSGAGKWQEPETNEHHTVRRRASDEAVDEYGARDTRR